MAVLHSILVHVDAMAVDDPALERAIFLAARCGARVKIVDVLPWVPPGARGFVTADLERELVDHRRGLLETIAGSVRQVPASIELLRGRPATALIQEVLRSGHDLLVRSPDRDRQGDSRSFGAIDMELLRQCPIPVWLVGRHDVRQSRRVLAAIHADCVEEVERGLNRVILDWALVLSTLDGAQLTVLQAWTAYGASLLRSRMKPDEFAAYVEAARRAAEDALTAFLDPFSARLAGVSIEIAEGEPEDAIVDFVERHRIDLVVMGTVARTGIAGLVMGNTAERVLQRLRGSVLAVKPPGFETPVRSA